MFEKLDKLKNQYEELTARMERPEVYSDAAAFAACEGLSYLPPRPTVSVAAETDITAAAAANDIAAGMFTTLPPAQRTIS